MNNAEHKFSSLCVYRKEDIELTELFRNEGVLLVNLANNQCSLKVLICYRKKDWSANQFYDLIQYLTISYNPTFILGDFNVKPNEELSLRLGDYIQAVSGPTHIGGSTLDHVYINNNFINNGSCVNVDVNSIFFSDHEMIRIRIKI